MCFLHFNNKRKNNGTFAKQGGGGLVKDKQKYHLEIYTYTHLCKTKNIVIDY